MDIQGNYFGRTQSIADNMMKRFDKADADQSGSVTLEEAMAAAPESASKEKLEKAFARVDQDGDGEFTKQEQLSVFQNRMDKLTARATSNGPFSGQFQQGDKALSILESLSEKGDLTQEQSEKVQSAIKRLEAERSSGAIKNAANLLQGIAPAINTQA